jgi:hypothetical protein
MKFDTKMVSLVSFIRRADRSRIFISFLTGGQSSAVSVIVPAPQDATQGCPLGPDQICEFASLKMTILTADGKHNPS